ncbi:MAG: DUF1554 domain-containing protein [Deltaproteobacteria bacterium]|nr:DUF1554 domain-containing protein [Deltaproteobacteria bacterium]
MKFQKLIVSVAIVCLMAFLNVSIFSQTAQAQPDLTGSMAEVIAQSLADQGYEVRLDGNSVKIATDHGELSLDLSATGEELEDSGMRARLVPQADISAEDIENFQQLQQCLNAADLNFSVTVELCELYTSDAGDFLCKIEATFDRILSSLKCFALYAEQEPPSGPVVSVFVTGRRYKGNLRGLAGADRKCQRRAEAAGLSGTWTAWLSDGTENAIDRIPDGQYQLIDGTQVADDKADLTDGSLNNAINLDEFGNQRTGFAWTGTEEDGIGTGNNCNDWKDNSSESGGDRGIPGERDRDWTQVDDPAQCSERYRLYCFGEGVE